MSLWFCRWFDGGRVHDSHHWYFANHGQAVAFRLATASHGQPQLSEYT